MTRGQIITIVLVAIVGLLSLMLLLAQVGGPQVRTASNLYQIGRLTTGSVVLSRGVPVTVGVTLGQVQGVGSSTVVLLRSGNEVLTIGNVDSTEVSAGQFKMTLPCDNNVPVDSQQVRLVLLDQASGVLAQSEVVAIAEAGPECFY